MVSLGACVRGNKGGYTLSNESWSLLLWCRNALINCQSPALGFNRWRKMCSWFVSEKYFSATLRFGECLELETCGEVCCKIDLNTFVLFRPFWLTLQRGNLLFIEIYFSFPDLPSLDLARTGKKDESPWCVLCAVWDTVAWIFHHMLNVLYPHAVLCEESRSIPPMFSILLSSKFGRLRF